MNKTQENHISNFLDAFEYRHDQRKNSGGWCLPDDIYNYLVEDVEELGLYNSDALSVYDNAAINGE